MIHDNHQDKILACARGFDTLTYDFGEVKPGAKLNFEFHHTNEDGYFIKAVTPGCGCTDPDVVDKNLIKGTYQIPAKESFGENTKEASYNKKLTVYFEDGSEEPIHKTFNGVHKLNPKVVQIQLSLNAKVIID